MIAWCPDCDLEMTETTRAGEMTAQPPRFFCSSCQTEWWRDASNDLRPIED